MNGWMGLICLAAYMWLTVRALTGHIMEPREMLAFSAIMAIAATRFLINWAREEPGSVLNSGRANENRNAETSAKGH